MNVEEEEEAQSQEHSTHKSAFEEMNDEEEEEGQSPEHSAHSKSAFEEMNNEEEVEEEATWEIADQTRVTSPEKPNQEDENIEEVFQIENMVE